MHLAVKNNRLAFVKHLADTLPRSKLEQQLDCETRREKETPLFYSLKFLKGPRDRFLMVE